MYNYNIFILINNVTDGVPYKVREKPTTANIYMNRSLNTTKSAIIRKNLQYFHKSINLLVPYILYCTYVRAKSVSTTKIVHSVFL